MPNMPNLTKLEKLNFLSEKLIAANYKTEIKLTDEEEDFYRFGFCKNDVWHWFDLKYEFFTFNHSYSMNTGKSNKSITQYMKMNNLIHKLSGVNVYELFNK